MRRRRDERQRICEQNLIVLCVTNRNIRGPEIVTRYLWNMDRIVALIEDGGPAFYGVYAHGVELLELDCGAA